MPCSAREQCQGEMTHTPLCNEPLLTQQTIKQAFKQELAWASHLGVPAIIIPRPQFRCFNYAHHLSQAVTGGSYLNVRRNTQHTPSQSLTIPLPAIPPDLDTGAPHV